MSEFISKYKKAKEELRQKLSREPTRGELAKKLKIPVSKVGDLELWIQKKASLDAPVGGDGDSQLSDFMKSSDYANTTMEVDKIFNKERVNHLLDSVGERERLVLDLRFGITSGKTNTLAEVAKQLDVSRERVRQIEKEALKKLQRYAKEEQKKELG